VSRAVRAAAIATGAVVALVVVLAAYALVAPAPAVPAPAPGPAPTAAGIDAAALVYLLGALVVWVVKGMRRAAAVLQQVRQDRRCPFCGAWFNTTPQQDAHERDCDQKPTDPTPAEVLELAFPFRRHQLGRWSG